MNKEMIKKHSDKMVRMGGAERWTLLGKVGIDSGSMVIRDANIAMGSAVEFMAGFGDGTYQVWGRIHDFEDVGPRMVEVRVVLVKPADVAEAKEMGLCPIPRDKLYKQR